MGQHADRNDSIRHEKHAELHQLAELLRSFGPFHLRLVGQLSWLRKLLAPLPSGFELDSLHERELDTRPAPRLDLGEQRTVGLDAVSLWELATFYDSGMGVDPGRALRPFSLAT